LLRLGLQMDTASTTPTNGTSAPLRIGNLLSGFIRRLLPDE